MGVLEAFREARQRSGMRLKVLRAGQTGSGMTLGSIAGLSGINRYSSDLGLHQDQYLHNTGYVYSIVRVICNRIAGQPLRVARPVTGSPAAARRLNRLGHVPAKGTVPPSLLTKAGQEANLRVLHKHPILTAFENPNPVMVRHTVVVNTVASMELTGKAYWWLRWEEGEDPQIWPLPSHWVEPVHTEKQLFDHWMVSPGGQFERFKIPRRELVYFYYPDPSDPLSAYSPLQALARTVMCDESVEESQRRSFLNALRPELAILIGQNPDASGVGVAGAAPPSPVLTRAQRKSLRVMLKEEYRGVVNTGEPLVLDGFIRDVKNLSLGPREFDFLNSGQATKARLAQGWGVNPISMGEIEGANRASSAVADQHLLDNVVNPRIRLMSEVMTAWMPAFFGDKGDDDVVYLEMAQSRDIDWELARDAQMVDRGGMSLNEWRDANGKPRIKGGDRAMVQGEWESVVLADQDGDGSDDEDNSESRDRPRGTKRAARSEPPRGTVAGVWGAKRVSRYWERQGRRFEGELRAALAQVLASLGGQAMDQINRLPGALTASLAEGAIDRAAWVRAVRRAARPVLREAALSAAATEWALHQSAPKRGVAVPNRKDGLPHRLAAGVESFVADLLGRAYWGKMVGTIIRTVRAAVRAARKENTDPTRAAAKVLTGERAVAERALGIAATEAAAAIGGGRNAVYGVLVRQGRASGRKWVTVGDDRVRHDHRQANGQVVRGDAAFRVGGESARFPGDPDLSPGNRINCRCVTVVVE